MGLGGAKANNPSIALAIATIKKAFVIINFLFAIKRSIMLKHVSEVPMV